MKTIHSKKLFLIFCALVSFASAATAGTCSCTCSSVTLGDCFYDKQCNSPTGKFKSTEDECKASTGGDAFSVWPKLTVYVSSDREGCEDFSHTGDNRDRIFNSCKYTP